MFKLFFKYIIFSVDLLIVKIKEKLEGNILAVYFLFQKI